MGKERERGEGRRDGEEGEELGGGCLSAVIYIIYIYIILIIDEILL